MKWCGGISSVYSYMKTTKNIYIVGYPSCKKEDVEIYSYVYSFVEKKHTDETRNEWGLWGGWERW